MSTSGSCATAAGLIWHPQQWLAVFRLLSDVPSWGPATRKPPQIVGVIEPQVQIHHPSEQGRFLGNWVFSAGSRALPRGETSASLQASVGQSPSTVLRKGNLQPADTTQKRHRKLGPTPVLSAFSNLSPCESPATVCNFLKGTGSSWSKVGTQAGTFCWVERFGAEWRKPFKHVFVSKNCSTSVRSNSCCVCLTMGPHQDPSHPTSKLYHNPRQVTFRFQIVTLYILPPSWETTHSLGVERKLVVVWGGDSR